MYREILWPRFWVWLMPVSFAACLGIAYGYAYSARVGWLVGGGTAVLLLGWLAAVARTPVEVAEGHLRAGRARLPLRYVGRVAALGPAESFEARTRRADPAAFLQLAPWASSRSVVVEVTDPLDPHPYWLISTRHPQELVRALRQAQRELHAEPDRVAGEPLD